MSNIADSSKQSEPQVGGNQVVTLTLTKESTSVNYYTCSLCGTETGQPTRHMVDYHPGVNPRMVIDKLTAPNDLQPSDPEATPESSKAQSTTNRDDLLREALLETIDYARHEQEWAALKVREHKPVTKHEKNCGVCVKMRVLNEQAVDQILALTAQQRTLASLDARIEEMEYISKSFDSNQHFWKQVNDRIAALQAERAKLIGGDNE